MAQSRRGGRPAGRRSSRARSPDPLSLLAQDHRSVERLFKRARRDPSVFDRIREELDVHAQVEEELFYPAVQAALGEEGEELLSEARQELDAMKALLSELAGLDRRGHVFAENLQRLKAEVEHHVEEEEGEIFEKTRRAMSKDELGDLGETMERRKEEVGIA
jgi:hemerythrin-like domain-containing protein